MKPSLGNIIHRTTPIYHLQQKSPEFSSLKPKTTIVRKNLPRFRMFEKMTPTKCLSCPNAR